MNVMDSTVCFGIADTKCVFLFFFVFYHAWLIVDGLKSLVYCKFGWPLKYHCTAPPAVTGPVENAGSTGAYADAAVLILGSINEAVTCAAMFGAPVLWSGLHTNGAEKSHSDTGGASTLMEMMGGAGEMPSENTAGVYGVGFGAGTHFSSHGRMHFCFIAHHS
jgi:hypothetical protein